MCAGAPCVASIFERQRLGPGVAARRGQRRARTMAKRRKEKSALGRLPPVWASLRLKPTARETRLEPMKEVPYQGLEVGRKSIFVTGMQTIESAARVGI